MAGAPPIKPKPEYPVQVSEQAQHLIIDDLLSWGGGMSFEGGELIY